MIRTSDRRCTAEIATAPPRSQRRQRASGRKPATQGAHDHGTDSTRPRHPRNPSCHLSSRRPRPETRSSSPKPACRAPGSCRSRRSPVGGPADRKAASALPPTSTRRSPPASSPHFTGRKRRSSCSIRTSSSGGVSTVRGWTRAVRQRIATAEVVWVSAASGWEAAIKQGLGKLRLALAGRLRTCLGRGALTSSPGSPRSSALAGR